MNKDLYTISYEKLYKFVLEKDYSDLNYLFSLALYLDDNPSELYKYLKSIKKSLKIINKSFDDTYLLLFRINNNEKVFEYALNQSFVFYVEILVHLLELNGNNDLSEKLVLLKTKIELGLERYMIHDNNVVSSFSTNEIFELVKPFNEEINVKNILIDILLKKVNKNKTYIKQFDKLKKYLLNFPTEIYFKDNKKLFEIKKSLFLYDECDYNEFKKDGVLVRNIDSIEVINLINFLLKDQKMNKKNGKK